jgi:hypothetical protein
MKVREYRLRAIGWRDFPISDLPSAIFGIGCSVVDMMAKYARMMS